jgi:hypothetical protein
MPLPQQRSSTHAFVEPQHPAVIRALAIYSIWRVWWDLEYKWLIVLGFALAFVLQSHYFGLLLLPTIGIFWGWTLVKTLKTGHPDKRSGFLLYSSLGLCVFALLFSPLILMIIAGWSNLKIRRFLTATSAPRSLQMSSKMQEPFALYHPDFGMDAGS